MYSVELNLPLESSFTEVSQFASDHGCNVTITDICTDDLDVSYNFTSDNFEYIRELTEQVLGCHIDEEIIKTIILEI